MKHLTSSPALLAIIAALAVTACSGDDDLEVQIRALRVLGSASLPTGTLYQGVEFGGISGLDKAADGTYWAISDDRGGERGTPRFYNLSIDYESNSPVQVKINRQLHMLQPDGTTFSSSARTVDPESIRRAPNGNLYWTSEGNWSSEPSQLYQPFLREMTTEGRFVREFSVPAMYLYRDDTTTGARNNKVFEALAVAEDGTVYVANEDALVQDGPITSMHAGSVVRVTAMDPASGNAKAQYVYRLPPIPVDAAPGAGAAFGPDNGLSELLSIGRNRFIAVERAFAPGVGNTIRLVETEITATTTNVLAVPSLTSASYSAMGRKVLLEMPITHQGIKLDNIESITWGKTLANGRRTLVLAADNNFTARIQTNQFIVLEVVTD
ncbi:esterase-like activity of phytase family protein [Pantoea sp. 18069]|uniref:esterase-like activity of phytase family protein n=1 Tax=Pantoea sp. 18069 TaxID=2681415 RepID=UPI00190F7D23|nr:esterase-like activity of phytase family protein [Pantoea sp. 18069]